MRILPTTRLARVALVIDAVAVAVYALSLARVDSAGAGGRALGLGIPLLAMLVGAVLALIAIMHRGERSLLAWVALIPGVLALLGLLAELTGLIE